MSSRAQRPLGFTLIVVIIALNGLLSIAEAFSLFGTGPGNLPVAIVFVVLGLLLINRAYGLWRLRYSSWLITEAILGFKAVLALLPLIESPHNILSWIDFGVVAATILYLSQPSVRALFTRQSAR